MAPIDSFLEVTDVLPEPVLLVFRTGTVAGVNAACAAALGREREWFRGRDFFEDLAGDRSGAAEFLARCARGRQPLPGSLALRVLDGGLAAYRAEGALLRPASADSEALVLIRLAVRERGGQRFVALTRKVDELSAEIARRRAAELATEAAIERQRSLQVRLGVLAEASGALFASLAVADILPAVGLLAERLVPADAHAVWQLDEAREIWRAVWHRHLSDGFAMAIDANAAGPIVLPEPLMVADTAAVGLLGSRAAKYEAEGIRSLVLIPLQQSGHAHATVVAYFRRPQTFDESDRMLAQALGNLGSSALATATLYEAESGSRAAAEAAERRAGFLARVGAALASSLDYEATLTAVARSAVPEIADWCGVDVVTPSGTLRRLAVAHVEPAKTALVRALEERYPRDPEAAQGAYQVVRSLTPLLMEEIPEAVVIAAARDGEHLALLRELGLTSYICVPLAVRGRAVGALTFAMGESGRRYTPADLRFAEEVASRAALAVENARAYDEVSRANRLKDDFLATLSHELRTPLNAVLGYTRMLRTGALPADRHARALETIERNATSLTQLVEDVLDVSRIEAGKIRLNVQPVSLGQVVEAAIATVLPAAEARGIRIEAIVDPGVPQASGDPDRLQQVVWNLLSNAVKFTGKGGRVQIRLERVNSHLEIVVSDTGAGIAPDFLPFMFERFLQGDSRFAREHGGLGLGLAITRSLVEMHGGTIHASSEGVGHGATFRVRLPLRIIESAATRLEPVRVHPRAAPSPQAPALQSLAGIHVLAVDDDPDALLLLKEVLEAAGAVVSVARSAEQALEQIHGAPPHVLISDLGMPGTDGFALIGRIRELPDAERSRIPAAALTAYARSEDRTRVLQSGFQMHLAKPINPAELAAAVRSLVSRGPGAAS